LLLHSWRTNVRELGAVIEQTAAHVAPPKLTRWAVDRVLGAPTEPATTSLTGEQIERALQEAGGNESAAARRLASATHQTEMAVRAKIRRFLGKA
jgi:DNA-binding NtrC family response regulator